MAFNHLRLERDSETATVTLAISGAVAPERSDYFLAARRTALPVLMDSLAASRISTT